MELALRSILPVVAYRQLKGCSSGLFHIFCQLICLRSALYNLIFKKMCEKNRNKRFSVRHFYFLWSDFTAICVHEYCTHIIYNTLLSVCNTHGHR